ncbi:hypothetical protein AVEN_238713-1 [Araneus ventricosus]|uniref:Uncharacterized protein n=1 Tax=Araneus ventricosus TaxID=182803 RepID=A0A4Y2BYG2_ARAVE|nr:hypothetical protein AVEN_238713-1 [Araneus ventricosus]
MRSFITSGFIRSKKHPVLLVTSATPRLFQQECPCSFLNLSASIYHISIPRAHSLTMLLAALKKVKKAANAQKRHPRQEEWLGEGEGYLDIGQFVVLELDYSVI